ncbi:MAG: TonB-dependent receptor, partial [Alphaproteobacteria bacterium]|nr:TonB-dependent receptor [Alphaproteobacteria bacterium]
MSLDLDVVARQLDIARSEIQPSLGASVFDFSRQAIETQPQGDNQPLNRLLLQAPGVAQDSFGQLHVRNDHANLQFRINGVQLPEGINVFGQALQTRLANSVALITGSLPAQYGLRTTGIIDIQTKTGTLNPGGSATLYGGQQGTFQPSAELGGRVGQIDYYATGEYLQNSEGIENPAPTFNAIHDNSIQPKGFAYVSGIIDPTSRLTAILGASRSQYQIPQVAGQTPSLGLTVNGITDFPSANIDENQRQINEFSILAWQKRLED